MTGNCRGRVFVPRLPFGKTRGTLFLLPATRKVFPCLTCQNLATNTSLFTLTGARSSPDSRSAASHRTASRCPTAVPGTEHHCRGALRPEHLGKGWLLRHSGNSELKPWICVLGETRTDYPKSAVLSTCVPQEGEVLGSVSSTHIMAHSCL